MLKTRVIADNVLNLTDARYFAALGVDYLIFNLSKIGKDSIVEIVEWVEGVELLLGVDEELNPQLLEFILKISPAGFVSESHGLLTAIKDQLPEKIYFLRSSNQNTETHFDLMISEEELSHLSRSYPDQKVFARTTDVLLALSSEDIDGIVVEGEQEEKIGFKNFDKLDELFEKLLIES